MPRRRCKNQRNGFCRATPSLCRLSTKEESQDVETGQENVKEKIYFCCFYEFFITNIFRFKEDSLGITKDDYLSFYQFLNNINDIDVALTFYHIAGASIDQQTLKHVAKTVAHIDLSDHVINVVFTIFDENRK